MKTNNLITIFITSILIFGCSQPKLIRKKIGNNDIEILWYYHSNITNNSPDKIEVINTKNGDSKIIFKGSDVITDVSILKDTITIKLFEPYRGIIYEDFTKDKILGYYAKIDTNATLDDYRKIPDGIKESFF